MAGNCAGMVGSLGVKKCLLLVSSLENVVGRSRKNEEACFSGGRFGRLDLQLDVPTPDRDGNLWLGFLSRGVLKSFEVIEDMRRGWAINVALKVLMEKDLNGAIDGHFRFWAGESMGFVRGEE